MTTGIFAAEALLPEGWARNVRLTLKGDTIGTLAADAVAGAGDLRVGALVPGMPNLHSHAFQRGMAGLAERRGATADSFWTWREVMYHFALTLTPEEAQAVAEMAYMEMLEQGFTRVGEFHYLHHDRDGGTYADPAEMSLRIIAAAEATGINLTHLPVFYAHADFGGKAPNPGQRRFTHDLDAFARLMERARAAMIRPLDRLGIAPHSLRAVTEDELQALVAAHGAGPVHIHIAEQTREVDDCVAACGQRPVERLLANFPVDGRWCLIHATHLTPAETQGIAASGAVVGLCPVTEANLGDGLFPAGQFLALGGRIGIGSDSNVEISVREELKLLEYGQRLAHRQRNVLSMGEGSTGRALFAANLAGGAQALAAPAPELAVGAPADLVALSDRLGLPDGADRTLDRWLFGTDVGVADVWAGGRHLVAGGRHAQHDRIVGRFAAAISAALSRS